MYGVGLLGYRDNSFLSMDVIDFLDLVGGAMRWEVERDDRLFEQLSIFTAHLMVSTGNYKKDTNLNEMRKQLYMPFEEKLKALEKEKSQGNKVITKKEIEMKKAELQEKFNI